MNSPRLSGGTNCPPPAPETPEIVIRNCQHKNEEIGRTTVTPLTTMTENPDMNAIIPSAISPVSDVDGGIPSDASGCMNLDDLCHIGTPETEPGSGDSPILSPGLSTGGTHQEGLESIASGDSCGRPSYRRTRRRERSSRDGLKLLNVSCSETGVTLYQQSWHWTETKEQDSIGKLVASFSQFANSIQCGEIGLINFVSSSRGNTHRKASSSSTHFSTPGVRRNRSPVKHTLEAMQMLCTHSDYVAVAVFYDIRHETVTNSIMQQPMRDFMESCKDIFLDLYTSAIKDLRPLLRSAVEEGSNVDLKEFQRPFDDFHAITAKLRREVLSPFIKKTSR